MIKELKNIDFEKIYASGGDKRNKELKIEDKGYFSDSLDALFSYVNNKNNYAYGKITGIMSNKILKSAIVGKLYNCEKTMIWTYFYKKE